MIVIENKEEFKALVREAVREELQGNGNDASTVTVEEAAHLCKCNPQTVRNWINKGIVKNRGTSGKKLVRVADIQKFMPKSARVSP